MEEEEELGLATGKEEGLLLTNYDSSVDTVCLEHIEDSLVNQESPLLQETRTEYPQDKKEGQQAPTPPTRIHLSVTSYEDRTSGLSDNQTEEGSTSEQDHDKDRDRHRVDVRPDYDAGAAGSVAPTTICNTTISGPTVGAGLATTLQTFNSCAPVVTDGNPTTYKKSAIKRRRGSECLR